MLPACTLPHAAPCPSDARPPHTPSPHLRPMLPALIPSYRATAARLVPVEEPVETTRRETVLMIKLLAGLGLAALTGGCLRVCVGGGIHVAAWLNWVVGVQGSGMWCRKWAVQGTVALGRGQRVPEPLAGLAAPIGGVWGGDEAVCHKSQWLGACTTGRASATPRLPAPWGGLLGVGIRLYWVIGCKPRG